MLFDGAFDALPPNGSNFHFLPFIPTLAFVFYFHKFWVNGMKTIGWNTILMVCRENRNGIIAFNAGYYVNYTTNYYQLVQVAIWFLFYDPTNLETWLPFFWKRDARSASSPYSLEIKLEIGFGFNYKLEALVQPSSGEAGNELAVKENQ